MGQGTLVRRACTKIKYQRTIQSLRELTIIILYIPWISNQFLMYVMPGVFVNKFRITFRALNKHGTCVLLQ